MTLRAIRSSSKAGSERCAMDTRSPPLVARGEMPEPAKLLPDGEPDFLCSNELKKLASTPSPLGVPGFSLPSTCKIVHCVSYQFLRKRLSQSTFFGDPCAPADPGVRGVVLPALFCDRIGDSPLVGVWPCWSSCNCRVRNACSSSVWISISRLDTVCNRTSKLIELIIRSWFFGCKIAYLSWRRLCNNIIIAIIRFTWLHILVQYIDLFHIVPSGGSENNNC